MQTKQSKKQGLKNQRVIKRKSLFYGVLIVILIAVSPLIALLYKSFPSVQRWETFFGTYESGYYEAIDVLAWVLFQKLVPLYLLIIWFLTCRHWWYHALIIPIVMYIIQIYTTLGDDFEFIDSNEYYILVPVIVGVLAFSYGIRNKIFDRIYGIDLENTELKRVRWNGKIVSIPADSPLDLPEVGDNEVDEDEEEDDDKEPSFMG